MKKLKIALSTIIASACCLQPASAGAQSLTIQGRLADSSNIALADPATEIRVQILTPDGHKCVLFDESHTANLNVSRGLFSINLNDGNGLVNPTSAMSLEAALSNRLAISVPSGNCATGPGTYSPAPTDNRKMRIMFKLSTSSVYEEIDEMDIQPVAYAMDSRSVDGYPATSLLRVGASGVPGPSPELTASQAAALPALAEGTSNKYLAQSTATGAQMPVRTSNPGSLSPGAMWFDNSAGQKVLKYYDGSTVQTVGGGGGGAPSGTASGDLGGSYPSPTVDKIKGVSLSISSLTSGHYLKYNGTNWINSALTLLDLPTIDLTKGGTGLTSGGSGDQLLGMNAAGTAMEYKTLTAGPNVTITPAAGSLTISAAAGLSPIASQTLLANSTGASAAPTATTLSHLLDTSISANQGSILFRNSTGWTVLPPGTNGYVLKTQGLAADPIWAASTGGGGTVSSVDVSAPFMSSSGAVTGSGNVTLTYSSHAANTALLAPNGSSGAPTFRAISMADLRSTAVGSPELFNVAGACGAGLALNFNSVSSRFECLSYSITSGQVTTALGFTPAPDSGSTNVISVGTITTGTWHGTPIAPNYGGTGLNSAGSSNQVLGMNNAGTAMEYKSITAGSGVTINQTAGGIEIVAAGSGGTVTGVSATGLLGSTGGTTPVISMNNIGANTLLGNASGSSAAPSATTLSALLDSSTANARGSILYRGASGWNALAPGTSGQFLKTLGTGGDPAWDTVAAGGITSVDVSAPFMTSAGAINSNGTVALTYNSQSAGVVLAGPTTGSAAPTFRALSATDIPNLNASKITSGALAAANGGTGLSALGGGDQILGVNAGGTAAEYKTLVAGTNITITPGVGTVTIASTGGTGTLAGDVTGSSSSNTVAALRNVPVSSTAPGVGNVLRYASSTWAPAFLQLDDIKVDSTGTANIIANATCTTGQMLTYAAGTHDFRCTAFAGIPASAISSGTIDAARLPAASATSDGIINQIAQSIKGAKTFLDAAYFSSGISVTGNSAVSGVSTAGGVVSLGGVKIGGVATSCDGTNEGTIRYNSTSKKMEYCDGSNWKSVGAGTQATIAIGPPSSSLVKSGPVTYTISYGSGTDSNGITLAASDVTFGGTATSGCSAVISGTGLTRTVTVNGCTGTGTVNISLLANTASSTTGDAAPAAGPSTNFNADNTGPTAPTSLTLGATPANLTDSPTISYSPGTDVGGSTVANHQVQLVKTSDSSVFYAWANHTSGTAVTGMTVPPNTQFAVYARAVDALGNAGSASSPVTFTSPNCVAGSQTFSYTGGVQNFVVPGGCSTIFVKMWGAGGAGGRNWGNGNGAGGNGGAGAFVSTNLAVTSGESLSIRVAGGGGVTSTAGWSGGGAGGNNGGANYAAGGGGGGSMILRSTTVLAAAGGGGGGGSYGDGGSVPHAGAAGTTGASGTGVGTAAGGGNSNVAGGSAGIGASGYNGTAGSASQGGTGSSGNSRNGGGGGGGYYGGGGGGGGYSSQSGAGGGGGSSYSTGSGNSYLNGSGKVPGGNGDAAYTVGIGVGGDGALSNNATSNTAGGNGLIVISYQP